MKREEILKLLEQVGAVRTGHFELSSGRHSGTYIQCALVLEHPEPVSYTHLDVYKRQN